MTRHIIHPTGAGMHVIGRFAHAWRGYLDHIRADDAVPASVAVGDIRAAGLYWNQPTTRGGQDQPLPSPRRRPIAKAKKIAYRLALLLLSGLSFGYPLTSPAFAQPQSRDPAPIREAFGDTIAEAARRFGIPAAWIRAVIATESGGDPRAVSPKGAMGLMQIMPATWTELRGRHDLGTDPYDPRDNILAGAAYLREMRDRYGAPGLLAAYHAGPGRYEDYLATGRPLPAATIAYVATLALLIGSEPLPDGAAIAADPRAWTRSALFVTQGARKPAANSPSAEHRSNSISATPIPRDAPGITPQSNGLFVARASAGATP